jgi:peptidoglycan hydrolase-like protein with peptidoglycan-binding domain
MLSLTRDLNVNMTGDDVRALQTALTQLGSTVPAAESQQGSFGPGTHDLVLSLQKQYGLPATGTVDAATVNMINGLFYTVSGHVYSAARAGTSGLSLQVVDKSAGPDVVLAKGSTGANGAYSITYPIITLAQPNKTSPDIQIHVSNGAALLGSSAVRYNASPVETLDVHLPDSAASSMASEFDSLTGAIASHYTGALGALQESGDRSDITYLANKTGWDARTVALAALADQFSQSSAGTSTSAATAGTSTTTATTTGISAATNTPKIPSQYFYALFRAGLPANADTLYLTDPKVLTAIWTQAGQQGVIPATDSKTLEGTVAAFQTIAAQKLLSIPALPGASALKDMLATAQLNADQQKQFANALAANRNDSDALWKAVGAALGADVTARLQNSGKLALLTLNNAPLMQAVTPIAGTALDPLKLVAAGYHRPSQWNSLLTANVPVPSQIPGDTAGQKRSNYGAYLAAQLRISYPTAAVAEMAGSGFLKLATGPKVAAFLTQHQGKFELGTQSVQQFVNQNKLQVDPATLADLKTVQRVHQITTTDAAMAGLLKNNLSAAYHVVRYNRESFVNQFANDLGGADAALESYNKALQIHSAALNVALTYLTARTGIKLGNAPVALDKQAAQQKPNGSGQILQPGPQGSAQADSDSVPAYPTLETLFGSMDFCACDDCRSILSPAAYLVDLLLFLDKPPGAAANPQAVFLNRRPDVQYLPLTCENTNTPLPYIDVVNETMEYYVANGSLTNYQGHDTGESATEDLMASPQFVLTTAYQTLLTQNFPPPLPFHRALESLRLYFNAFGVPLKFAMERLRKSDDLERGANPYGWRDILAEELDLSRQEYRILTDRTLTVANIYGFTGGESAQVIADTLSNAKGYARRIDISYDDLVALLRTHFINPNSELIPKLEKLGVTFGAIQALHDGTLSHADFLALLPTGSGAPDPAEYDNDIIAWLTDATRFSAIMGIITLSDPSGANTGCNFGSMELRYSKPVANAADTSTRLNDADFTRLLRFIRLWKKLGWTISQTDAALCALFRADLAPLTAADVGTLPALDTGFATALPRLGVVSRVMADLSLTPDRDLASLLACWSNIGVFGDDSLYRAMFVNPAMLAQDAAFAPNGYGEFLTDNSQTIAQRRETIRGAFNFTGDELDRILAALSFDNTTKLTLPNLSAIFRRGWLARTLRLSVREFLLLTQFTGIDPFAAPDIGAAPLAEPPVNRLIDLVQAMRDQSFKSAAALYLFWNQDLSGKSTPAPAIVTEFGRSMRGDFAAIDDQFAAAEDPNGDILRARLTLVYGQDVSDAFFALLDNTLPLDVPYTNLTPSLDPAITAADGQIAYDDFQHRLSHTGLLSATLQAALKAVPGVTASFQSAVDVLLALSQDALSSFFGLHPELKPPYDVYVASPDPVDVKRTALLNAFRPQLAALRKREQAIQKLSTASTLDLASTQALLDPGAQPFPLHSQASATATLLDDFIAIGTPGLSVQFFNNDTATGPVASSVDAASNLDYQAGSANPLPANPTPGAAISGIWQGRVEIPSAGYYNFVIATDAAAKVTLTIDGQVQPLTQNATSPSVTTWRNSNALSFKAGQLLAVVLTVEKVQNALTVSWETPKQSREVIPERYVYPPSVAAPFSNAYIRFMKTATLLTALNLEADELIWFATSPDYQIAGDGWLNVIPVDGDPTLAVGAALVKPLSALLDLNRIKNAIASTDESVVQVLQNPAAATAKADSLLFTLTRWDPASLNSILALFGSTTAGLGHFDTFRRVFDAFNPVQTLGIPAAALIEAVTNDPGIAGPILRDFQSALRARYAIADWRNLVQPVNNSLRSMQRDALIAYILQQFREAGSTIDTADKLYEYFLMDVQMEPCMQTSRIRHALSSLQLFVERCFLNLEPQVSPSVLDADQWVWMKRYRVWQANREVFLFPENWLEPELRDNKSPFFKDIESELGQSDITEDTAAAAMLNYLSKLHDVAKLEPCGMYLEENGLTPDDNTIHVVARNSDLRRKYYYRRYEFASWTAWEEIKLPIEDTPIVPVVWNNRLLLFWLGIQQQAPLAMAQPPAPANSDATFPNLTLNLVKADAKTGADSNAKMTYQAVLFWSEYYNGKWQPPKSSDPRNPAILGQYSAIGADAFDRSSLRLWADEPQTGELRISINGNVTRAGFLLFNTHGLPIPAKAMPPVFAYGDTRGFETTSSKLVADYVDRIPDVPVEMLSRQILTDDTQMNTVAPYHLVSSPWDAPFFFEDRRNVFYVTTTESPVWISNFSWYGVAVAPGIVAAEQAPPLVVQTGPPIPPKFWGDGGPLALNPGAVDPAPIARYITEDAYIRQGLATSATVQYGGVEIGPSGALLNGAAANKVAGGN